MVHDYVVHEFQIAQDSLTQRKILIIFIVSSFAGSAMFHCVLSTEVPHIPTV